MKQYGDISQLHGYELDSVDLIVGGSPCQDLSVAGKRAGLEGERSGLFMEMIRVIREMREKTDGIYPRYALWENVPGAFSSNGGADFGAVLTEFARIAEPAAPALPIPQKGWSKSGVLLGDNWSIAWRTHDAQYWGVPQRRRRISLIADFRGQSAPEILFEPKSLSGDSEQSGTERKEAAGTVGDRVKAASDVIPINTMVGTRDTAEKRTTFGIGNPGDPQFTISAAHEHAVMVLNDQGGQQMNVSSDVSDTLRAQEHGHQPIVYGFKGGQSKGGIGYQEECAPSLNANPSALEPTIFCLQGNGIDRADTAGCNGKGWCEDVSYTLNTIDRPAVFDSQVYHGCKEFGDVCQTVNAQYGTGGNNTPLVMRFQSFGEYTEDDTASCMAARDYKDGRDLIVGALNMDDYKGPNAQYVEQNKCQITNNTVRRLTPLECERLQGYPDGWTDIPGATDSKRYKALGNSIALPFWEHLAHRFAEIGNVKSIGSLFDGIGGFPLAFGRAGAETKWTSEIEPFCHDVVRIRFNEERGE